MPLDKRIEQLLTGANRPQTISEVAAALGSVDSELAGTDMTNLQNFNKTYLIITRNVRRQLEKGAFTYPAFMETFDTRFAVYYFDALRRFLKQKPTPPSWRATFNYCRRGASSPLIGMALGVNAHVNNDIPQVLRDCGAEGCHYSDYEKVNDVIAESIYEVLESLDDDGPIVSPKRRPLAPGYKFGMRMFVSRWRKQAWRNFCRLTEGKIEVHDLENEARRNVAALLKLPG